MPKVHCRTGSVGLLLVLVFAAPAALLRRFRWGFVSLPLVAIGPFVQPVEAAERTDWFQQSSWGVMTHYLGAPPSSSGGAELTAETWNRQVDAFDVEALADQLASTGAKYLLFTIGQNSGHYCAPNAAYDKIVAVTPSKCSRRDLVADLAEALGKRRIRLMVYLPSGAPAADVVARKKLGWQWGRPGGWQLPDEPVGGRLVEFQRKWEAVIREWSLRWGKDVAGWWIDGCYFADQMYRFDDEPNFASFAAALRAGNPESVVAFNPGVRVPVVAHTAHEDYTAGEVTLKQLPQAAATCPGRWLESDGAKVQYHILTYLGESWCKGEHPQWPNERIIGLTRQVVEKGGVVTFDVPIGQGGRIPQPFVEQLRAVSAGLLSMGPEKTAQGDEPDPTPNIVIILADDLGYGDLSCYGGTAFRTPHLDALAAEGMRLVDFHSSGPVCSPTRAGLVTGRYQQRAGVPGVIFADPKQNRHHGLHTHEVTFAERLKEAGYATAIFGKWHLGYRKELNPTHHGFDRFRGYVSGNVDYISHYDQVGIYDWWEGLDTVEEEGYTTHLITRHAVRFIEENKHRPFCVYVAHEAPHSPWQGPGDPPVRGPQATRAGAVRGDEIKRAYREMVQEMDKGVGDVVAAIKRLDLAGRTLVFFLSDNGGTPNGSNGPLRGHKGQLWEGGHRVPAIAWWPGRIAPGTTCDELSISTDLMPTMLALAGVDVPEGHELDGVNLLPVLLEGQSLGPRKLFWSYGRQEAMRDGPWKLVISQPKGEPPSNAPPPELFQLADDLGEEHNLADDHPERARTMQEAMRAWQTDVEAGATRQPDLPKQPGPDDSQSS